MTLNTGIVNLSINALVMKSQKIPSRTYYIEPVFMGCRHSPEMGMMTIDRLRIPDLWMPLDDFQAEW